MLQVIALETQQAHRRSILTSDETLRNVAIRRLQGDTNDEIASSLQMSVRSVERKLNLIRERWNRELMVGESGRSS